MSLAGKTTNRGRAARAEKNTAHWVAILGCESGIARECAALWARRGWNLHLASRDVDEAGRTASDLALRYGIQAKAWAFDATAYGVHESFWKKILPAPVGLLVAFGTLGDHDAALHDSAAARLILDVNFTGAVSILTVAASEIAKRKAARAELPCFIAAISSVAGERGRRSNYLYGSAKAGLTAFLSGLRSRLQPAGIPVLTVIPGFVRTDMTLHLKLPPLVTAEPGEVAKAIVRAVEKKADVVWVRPVWRLLFLAIRHLPESIFKRLSF